MEAWLHRWLQRQFIDAAQRHDGRCVRLQLFHLAGKQRGVRTWPFPDDVAESKIEALAEEILAEAQDDASSLFGRQRYSICAYYERRPDQVGESKNFLRDGGGSNEDDDDVDSEGPNQRGLLTQLMRHNELNYKTSTQATASVVRVLVQQNEMLGQRLHTLESDRVRSIQVYEGLLSERHLRELATAESAQKQKIVAEAFSKLQLLFPVLINKLAGAPVMPMPTNMVNEIVGSLVGSLTHEQMVKMGDVLTTEQMVVVLDLVDQRRKFEAKMKAEQDESTRALQVGASGAADAQAPGA